MKNKAALKSALAFSSFMLLQTAFLAGCDTPVSGSGNPSDSLDAESGKDKLNRYVFDQGNLISTGNVMDLAIEGSGFFVLKNSTQNIYFRRPAAFFQDADGYLILGNDKIRLQGIPLSDTREPYTGAVPDSVKEGGLRLSELADIKWPFNDRAKPTATSAIKIARNLDYDPPAQGSIVYTQQLIRPARASDPASVLMDGEGTGLAMQDGDVLTFSAMGGTTLKTSAFTLTASTTLADIAAAVTAFLRSPEVDAGAETSVEMVSVHAGNAFPGALTVFGNASSIRNFQVTSNRPASAAYTRRLFSSLSNPIPEGTERFAAATAPLRCPARATDLIGDVLDGGGNALGVEEGDRIDFSGSIAGNPTGGIPALVYAGGPQGTTLQDLLDKIREAFRLPERDGSLQDNLSVSVDPSGSDDGIQDGSIVIRGRPGADYAIRDVSIRCTDSNGARPSPNFFNTGMNATVLRDAADIRTTEASITVYDDLGKEHTLTIRFLPTLMPLQCLWEAGLSGRETLVKGAKGSLAFGQDASLASFTFADGATRLEFDPEDGASNVKVTLDMGGPGDFTGLTHFRNAGSAAVVAQNGFPAGVLRQLSIDEDGVIGVSYTNGQFKRLFQIPLAKFPNRMGLKRVGENSFLETAESGSPAVAAGTANSAASIKPGAVEYATDAEYAQLCKTHSYCAPAP